MPKNIVEAYALAVKARECCTRKAFEEVINFCEQNFQCSMDNSRKRNTLLLWAYDKLASSFARTKDYASAYNWWRKAVPLAQSLKVKLNLGINMLAAADKGFGNMREKASKIIETATFLQQVYLDSNDDVNRQNMQKLADKASIVLQQSNLKH